MKIKTRLSLYFTLISSGALLLVLIILYISVFASFKSDFNNRLSDRVDVASKLYLKADEIGADSLVQVQQDYLEKLPDEVIRVYNEKNKAAFDTSSGIYWSKNIIEQVRKEGHIEYQEGNRQVLGKYFKDNQGNFVILASAVDHNFERRIVLLGRTTVILFFAFSIVLFFAGQWFAQNALAPIQKVIAQMRLIRSTNLHLRLDEIKSSDEIAELIRNFNSLLERLENAFELQQSFVSNASHELRTPLTSIMGEAEIALSKSRAPGEYVRVLQSIATDAMRLQETITSLMELAQVDFSYTQAVLQPVRMDELLWELQESWTVRRGSNNIILHFGNLPNDENALIIEASKPLLYIALNNIIDNAFKYAGDTPVEILFENSIETIVITVTDKGPGIKPEEADKIFKPFYRTNNTKNIPGSGIGLYIASKIIHLCNGSIRVESDGHSGSSFIITFHKNAA